MFPLDCDRKMFHVFSLVYSCEARNTAWEEKKTLYGYPMDNHYIYDLGFLLNFSLCVYCPLFSQSPYVLFQTITTTVRDILIKFTLCHYLSFNHSDILAIIETRQRHPFPNPDRQKGIYSESNKQCSTYSLLCFKTDSARIRAAVYGCTDCILHNSQGHH